MNGLLLSCAATGEAGQAMLLSLRLALIPAGSTDAVACTLHGTRSVVTAAFHVALGDRWAAGPRAQHHACMHAPPPCA